MSEDLKALIAELRAAIDKAAGALAPMADAVFNDNGDLGISPVTPSATECERAYFARKQLWRASAHLQHLPPDALERLTAAREPSEEAVRAVGDLLMNRVNAPEQEIYRAARDALALGYHFDAKRQSRAAPADQPTIAAPMSADIDRVCHNIQHVLLDCCDPPELSEMADEAVDLLRRLSADLVMANAEKDLAWVAYHDGLSSNADRDAWKARAEAAEAELAKGLETSSFGWLYTDPQVGICWSKEHPIKNFGHNPHAEDVRPATAKLLADRAETVLAELAEAKTGAAKAGIHLNVAAMAREQAERDRDAARADLDALKAKVREAVNAIWNDTHKLIIRPGESDCVMIPRGDLRRLAALVEE